MYQLLKTKKGPKVTFVTLSPYSRPSGRRERFVAADDALAWLEHRLSETYHPDKRAALEDGIRHLRVERLMAHLRTGTPLPRPAQEPYVSAHRRSRGREGQPAHVPVGTFAVGAP
jgi:hypothetical protein